MIEYDISDLNIAVEDLRSENDSLRRAIEFLTQKMEIRCPYPNHDLRRDSVWDYNAKKKTGKRRYFEVCTWCEHRTEITIK